MTEKETPWIDGMTLQQALAATVQRHGRRDALVFPRLGLRWSYETFQAGLEPSKWRTPSDRYLGIHGLFLFVIVTFLIYQTRYT